MSINLNSKLRVESKSVISIGSIDSTMAHPREVFAPALKKGAAAVIVAHNHPSGDPEPSEEDVAVTLRLLEASYIVGVRLVDHVIVGRGSYTSMRDLGYIPE
jgi:DNA repair protein RadC